MSHHALDILIERLKKPDEKLVIGKLTGTSPAAIERKAIVEQVRTQSLSPDFVANQPMRFFEAVTHINATEFDQDYIFNLMEQFGVAEIPADEWSNKNIFPQGTLPFGSHLVQDASSLKQAQMQFTQNRQCTH